MAERSGFFNALNVNGEYDRKYNANDYSDNLAVVISNGVRRSNIDDLKCTINGMIVTVGAGRAWINGHYYYNDTPVTFNVPTAPAGGARYDRIMLRFNNTVSARNISLVYVEGVAGNSPVPPEPIRNDLIYDLALASVRINAGATVASIIDTRDDKNVCGWVYSTSGDDSFYTSLDNTFKSWFARTKNTLSSVTLFKRYAWSTTFSSATNVVAFNIPQYDAETCFIEVYTNGILDTDYTLTNNVITFGGAAMIAGTVITVNCFKSIDGTGIMTVADEITELQNEFASVDGIAKFTYVCTGVDDNISLSQIATALYVKQYNSNLVTAAANAFLQELGGNTYLAALADDAQINIDVVGVCNVVTPFSGSGTDESPYRWFTLGRSTTENERIIFDFAKCSKVNISCAANTTNYIFYGNDLNIRNANVNAYSTATGCKVTMIKTAANTGRIYCDNCRFTVAISGAALIAEHGTFTNCYGYVVSDTSTAYCFKPRSTGLIRVNSGEYYAYGATASGIGSAIFHTSSGDTDAVVIANNLHCPVVTKTNYTQTFLSSANAGNTYINGVVTRLTSSGAYNDIVGLINKNKA